MAEWIPIGQGFIVADVIRWKEGIFERRGGRKGKAVRIGERQVVAEVLSEPDKDGWVRLIVRKSETTWIKPGRLFVPQLDKNEEAKRKYQTLVRCVTERLAWSDESARESVMRGRPRKRELGAARGKRKLTRMRNKSQFKPNSSQ